LFELALDNAGFVDVVHHRRCPVQARNLNIIHRQAPDGKRASQRRYGIARLAVEIVTKRVQRVFTGAGGFGIDLVY
jgi:hypothetical protein